MLLSRIEENHIETLKLRGLPYSVGTLACIENRLRRRTLRSSSSR